MGPERLKDRRSIAWIKYRVQVIADSAPNQRQLVTAIPFMQETRQNSGGFLTSPENKHVWPPAAKMRPPCHQPIGCLKGCLRALFVNKSVPFGNKALQRARVTDHIEEDHTDEYK